MLLGKGTIKLLQVNDIYAGYGRATVLHGVFLEVKQGETVFIVGRNGAGKTTLLKTICGLLSPTKGTIVYEGIDAHSISVEKLARSGLRYVAQDKKVFSDLTVKDNVELAAYASAADLEKSVKKLTSIYPKFERMLDSKSRGLSGGEREMLVIARALVGQPKLLLIDEPTEGLAAIVINEVFNVIKEQVKGSSVSALIVEQNLSVVTKLADRVYVIKEGRIINEVLSGGKGIDASELESYL
jgi:ABC-type branched-subunit amino acid transport system ATPase component